MNEKIEKVLKNIGKVFIGKPDSVEACIAGLIAGGHILIEDVPGIGKTMLAKSLARSIDASFTRVQFTPDMLPSDITGSSVYNQKNEEFNFIEGPVFTNILLGDEINRTTPRTQSALLECMEEKQVSVEGETRKLGDLFFVIATQNPVELQGVYPLPEAQLDRFLMKISIGYPSVSEELEIIDTHAAQNPVDDLEPVVSIQDILEIQKEVSKVHIDKDLQEYAVRIIESSREDQSVVLGGSPRSSLALIKASRAFAYIKGFDFVSPKIVKDTAVKVLNHRIVLTPQARLSGTTPENVIRRLLETVDVPE
jgi:MoxR-like ATPase